LDLVRSVRQTRHRSVVLYSDYEFATIGVCHCGERIHDISHDIGGLSLPHAVIRTVDRGLTFEELPFL
jgi:hypothetical protein